jgi:hypothetical protein
LLIVVRPPPPRLAQCRATIFQEANAMLRRDFSRNRRDAAPHFFKRPAQCRATIFQEAGGMSRLPHHNFYLSGAILRDCHAAIFEECSVILRLPRCDF